MGLVTDYSDNQKDLGLGGTPSEDWPKVSEAALEKPPIERLRPGSRLHTDVLDYLLDRISQSERAMSSFYSRWQVLEQKIQAYVKLPDWEKALKQMNDDGQPPRVVSMVVPYNFATISTIVTYLLHIFTSREPIWPVGSYKQETINSARNMETVLQYQSNSTRAIKEIFQFLQDGQVYGVSAMLIYWRELYGNRTTRSQAPVFGANGMQTLTPISKRQVELVYQGNMLKCLDPYMFFPDPRVPMSEVNKRGEYVFWRTFEGTHILKREQAAGNLQYVDYAGESLPKNQDWQLNSQSITGGTRNPALSADRMQTGMRSYKQLDQGTIELIPAELGLGPSEVPEKWIFTILNKRQIAQAQPFDADHGMHPVAVSEPYPLGHGFGHLSVGDYMSPIQDTIGWLVNSHMDNVRRVLNDFLIVDPTRIEMQDLRKPGPGRIVRLKMSALGQDVRTAIQQMNVADVTTNHVNADLKTLFALGEKIGAVTENVMGTQDSGGRKTATEVRTASEFAVSRLAAMSRVISAQAMVDITEQMSINTQQYLSDNFYIRLTGQDGMQDPIFISPEMLVGNFHYPVHDGTLPIDKVALVDVWTRVLEAVMADPRLGQRYDIGRIFEYVAELGGARNIGAFRISMQSPQQIAQGVQNGQLVAPNQLPQMPAMLGSGRGPSGVDPNPGRRLLGVG